MNKVLDKTTKKYIIGYFDVLGYKNLIKGEIYTEEALIEIFNLICKRIKNVEKHHCKNKMKVYCFSDNFLVCMEYKSEIDYYMNIKTMIFFLALIQTQFLCLFGIQIRGCILEGNLYLGNNFVYGKGMVDAYNLENNIAKYPRIILEKGMVINLRDMIKRGIESCKNDRIDFNVKLTPLNMFEYFERFRLKSLLIENKISKFKYNLQLRKHDWVSICKDFDGQYYVDYFQYLDFINRNSKREEAEIFFKRAIISMGQNIEYINGDVRVLDKCLWSCKYINRYLNKFDRNIITEDLVQAITGLDLEKLDITIRL